MGIDTKIAWTDYTFNPWIGCTKVSAGCAKCYAEKYDLRWGGGHWGPGKPRRRTSTHNWNEPRRWDRQAAEDLNAWGMHDTLHGGMPHYDKPRRPRVFCASLADWLDDEVPIDWLVDLLELVRDCALLDWQLLTKRPENWMPRLTDAALRAQAVGKADLGRWILAWLDGSSTPSNVWLGTSVENQDAANLRIPSLLEIPACVRFLSMEPLLGGVDLQYASGGAAISVRLDWVILGGESGSDARPCDLRWMVSLVEQCKAAEVPVFVKQLGLNAWVDTTKIVPRDPKGGDFTAFPTNLQLRQFPNSALS